MKNQRYIISVMLLLCLSVATTNAQEAILSSGCSSTDNGGSVCFSVGQMAYSINNGSAYSLAEGVQQPIEISTLTGIEESWATNPMIFAYPNPTKDYIKLKVEDFKADNLVFQLYDLTGKLLVEEQINSNETYIDLSLMQQAIYFLKIIESDNEVQIFKIIKR